MGGFKRNLLRHICRQSSVWLMWLYYGESSSFLKHTRRECPSFFCCITKKICRLLILIYYQTTVQTTITETKPYATPYLKCLIFVYVFFILEARSVASLFIYELKFSTLKSTFASFAFLTHIYVHIYFPKIFHYR